MPHRILAEDGSYHCYACGIYSDERAAFAVVPCKPGGWEHPPYIIGLFKDGVDMGQPYVETCAAHPYSGCGNKARDVAYGQGEALAYATGRDGA